MQSVASVLADQFSDLLKRLPTGLDLDRPALETKAIQRKRELVDGASVLRIALARGPGGLSLRQTAAWASMLGIAALSNPGVKYRLNQATEFLAALVEHLLAAKVPGGDLRWPGRTLRLADGTCISKPGSSGTPSIRRYDILESSSVGLTVMERGTEDDTWRANVLTNDDILRIPEIGIEIPVSEFYEGLSFSDQDEASV